MPRSPQLRYLAAATSARLATEAFATAAVLLVLERTGSAALAGAVVAAAILPSVVLGPLLGVWLDDGGGGKALFVVNQVLFALTAGLLIALAGRAPGVLLLAAGTLAGASQPLVSAGFASLLPSIVGPEQLPRAYSLESSTWNLAAILGPAGAGGVAALAGAPVAVTAVGLCALASIPAIVALPLPARIRRLSPGALRSIHAGAVHLLSTPVLREVTIGTTLSFAAFGTLTVAFPLMARASTGSPEASGALWAAVAAGAAAGAALLPALTSRTSGPRAVGGCLLAMAAFLAALGRVESFAAQLVLAAAVGLGDGPALGAMYLVRQQHTPPALMSRAFMTAASLRLGVYALGSAMAAPIVQGLGMGTLTAAVGGAHAAGALLILARTSRRAVPA